MNKMTRILLFMLCLLTVTFTALPVSAEANEDGYDPDTLTYSNSVDWDKFRNTNTSINVYNWGEYIAVDDGEEGAFDVNAAFEELTGITVNYTNFASNEELYAKLKSGGAAYDIIIPSDYMIARLISEGMLEKLNFANIPNFSLIDDNYKNPDYDPTNEYSVPYTWGTVGIVYNTTLVDPEDDINTWNILWSEKYAKDILMFSNSRDAFAIALKRLGYSFNTTVEAELQAAADSLKEQKLMVQAYVMDEIFDKMGGGEAALAPYYAGDAITMIEDNPDLAWAIPVEGVNLFIDAICIPRGAANKEAAELYINFLCETLVALKNCEYIGYSTPHADAYLYLSDDLKSNPIAYPSDEVILNSETFTALPTDTTKLIDNLWTSILSNTSTNPYLAMILMFTALFLSLGINVWRRQRKKQKMYETMG